MTMQQISNILDEKINENEGKVVITFFEIRIKYNLSEIETNEFLKLSRTRLENLGYSVYFTGAKYNYQDTIKIVEPNELLVAIKDNLN